MKPADLNNGWRTTVVDVPTASGAHSTPTPTPSPPTTSSSSRQVSTLLKPRSIESEQAPTRSAGWRRSFASWAMRAARRARRSRSGSGRRRDERGSSAAGALREQQLKGAGAHMRVSWEVCTVCVVISYHYLTCKTLKRRWEGLWSSATLKGPEPHKKLRCESFFSAAEEDY